MIHLRVLAFGVLKDALGPHDLPIDLPDGATVADLLAELGKRHATGVNLRGIAVSVNAEYATAAQVLHDGDEVGLLPPVSGGAPRTTNASGHNFVGGCAE